MHNKVVPIIGGIALVGLIGGMVYLSLGSAMGDRGLVEFQRWVGCDACNEIYRGTLDDRPGTCEKCGQKALWAAVVCRQPNCGHKFPANIHKYRQARSEVFCPKCRSHNIGKILDEPPSP